jgi:hypothetical protein
VTQQPQPTDNKIDREVLAAVFAARVALAKKTEDEAAEQAREEHRKTIAWIASNSQKERSFLWFCDEFDLDAGAVRRAIQEKR